MPKVQELRDVADWQRWANVGIQEQLCEKMEALKAVEDPEAIAKQVRDLQQQWRQAADVPRAQGEALWRRFKTAHDEAWTRCEAHFAAQAEARAENLAKKIALVRARRGARRVDQLDSDRRRDQEAAGRVEDDRPGQPRPGKGDLGALPRRLRSVLHAPPRRSRRAQDGLGGEPGEEGSAVRQGRGARAIRPTGTRPPRDQAAAGRVEDDRSGEEDALRSDLAALPRRVRRVLRALRAAPRHRARRTRRGARGDCRGAGSAGRTGSRQSSVVSRQSSVVSRQSSVVSRQSRVVGRSRSSRQSTGPSRSHRQSAMPGPPAPDPRGQSGTGDCSSGPDRAGAIAARPLAAGDRRARRRSRSRRGARRALRRGVQPRARALAGGVRRHRSRSRREPQADGSARRSGWRIWRNRSAVRRQRQPMPRCRRPPGWRRC